MNRVEINGRVFTLSNQELQKARAKGAHIIFVLEEGNYEG